MENIGAGRQNNKKENIYLYIEETMTKVAETREKTDWQEKISGAWLQGMPGISRRKKRMLLELCADVKSILLLKEKELLEILNYDELLRWQ